MGPGVGAEVVLISLEGGKLRYAVRIHFPACNNVAEYEGLINGLQIAVELGATRLYVFGDSKLVVNQVMKDSNCESPLMDVYYQEVRKLDGKFRGLELHHIPQKDNSDADALAKMAAERKLVPNSIFANDLHTPSVREKPPTAEKFTPNSAEPTTTGPTPSQTPEGPHCLVADSAQSELSAPSGSDTDWRADLLAYILNDILPADRNEARQIA